MAKKDLHVVPSTSGGWAVRRTGAERAAKIFSTQGAAVKHARQLAKEDMLELYVHKKDGTIRDRDSYGNYPNSPRDKTGLIVHRKDGTVRDSASYGNYPNPPKNKK